MNPTPATNTPNGDGQEPNTGLDALLDYLKRARGFDFGGYKRPSLTRRIERRLQSVGAANLAAYRDYLEVNPDELDLLFDTILINVTAFFRDPTAWEYIRDEIVPRILAGKGTGEPIRVWSAACASGEEAYTLAILLAEALGVDEFRERVKIYATDVDDDALAQARQGMYDVRSVAGVPPALLEKYFDANASQYAFRKDLRRALRVHPKSGCRMVS